MSSSSSRTPGPATARDARSQTPSTITRSMSRYSLSSQPTDPSTSNPSSSQSHSKPSLPSARRISSNPHSTGNPLPRTRSSTSLATRSSALTGKSAASQLSTSRARRVLSESQATSSLNQPVVGSSLNMSSATSAAAMKRSVSSSIASIRSPPRQGVRRYSRAEAGGLTGFGVVKAGPRVVSPVKMETGPSTTTATDRLGGGGGNVNDPYSTAFQRPTFNFETTQPREIRRVPPPSHLQGREASSGGSFTIQEDRTSKAKDEDELQLSSPRKATVPFSPSRMNQSPANPSSHMSPSKRHPFGAMSPRKARLIEGDENMNVDSTVTIPIRPSSPVRGALSPRTLLAPSQTLRRTKPSRKIEEVESSSSEEDDDLDFLSPRKKAKLPTSTEEETITLPRSAPSSTTSRSVYTSKIARARTSVGSTPTLTSNVNSKTIDRSQLLRSPPPKKPSTFLPPPTLTTNSSSTSTSLSRPLVSSTAMQRTAGRAFPLPSSLPSVPPIPAQSLRSFPPNHPSSSLPVDPVPLSSTSRPLAYGPSANDPTSSSSLTQQPAPLSRLPRRISLEHSSSLAMMPPPPPPPSAPARAISPIDPSLSLMSIDESQEESFSTSTTNLGDVSTTSVRSEETAKRLANLQNMLSRLQMPRKSVGGGVPSSVRTSVESSASSGTMGREEIREEASTSGARRTSLPISTSTSRQRQPSGPTTGSRSIRVGGGRSGGIVDTSSSSIGIRRPSTTTSSSSSTASGSRRISSSFLPSQSFDMSTTTMSDISMISSTSMSNLSSEPTIKALPQNNNNASSVLNGVVAFVDVRTGEGDDSGMIFVDMLKNLGARVTTRPSSLTTHVIFKSGRPSTLQYVRGCVRPPKVVGIAWVVRCAEIRQKADERAFTVVEEKKEVEKENSMFAIGAGKPGPAQKRRRSMEPKALAALNSSTASAGSSNPALKASIAASLERARLRSLQWTPKVGSPLAKRVFVMPDLNDNEDEDQEDE
ncbi:hypothetical protein JCM16303_006302 [Sporobolomyces ruberrimus]